MMPATSASISFMSFIDSMMQSTLPGVTCSPMRTKGGVSGRGGFVEGADDGALRVDELRVGFGGRSFGFGRRRGGSRRRGGGSSDLIKSGFFSAERSADAHAVFAALHFQFGDTGIGNQLDQLPDLFNCHAID